jgi:hypothetical protein
MAQVAQFSAELGQYAEAIGIYEDVAKRCVDNNLLKYSAKGYLLNAGICHLCGELPPFSIVVTSSESLLLIFSSEPIPAREDWTPYHAGGPTEKGRL